MRIVSRNTHNAIRYLTPISLEALYAKMKSEFSSDQISFFTKPERRSSETIWYAENQANIESFQSLSEDDQDTVSDYIESKKAEILKIIDNIPELKAFGETLFTVPSTENIIIFRDGNNQLSAALSQWSCTKLENTNALNPISILINRPRINRSRVTIKITYSDGSIAANKAFSLEYGETLKNLKTDNSGIRDLGNFKNGVQFQIYATSNGHPQHIHNFTVLENVDLYEVIFPYYTELRISVNNSNGEAVPDTKIELKYEGQITTAVTNADGKLEISALEAGKDISVQLAEYPEQKKTLRLEKENNQIDLKIHLKVVSQATVRVLDENDAPLVQYPLYISIDKAGVSEFYSDSQGTILLNDLAIHSSIEVSDTNNAQNKVEHIIVEGKNEVFIKIQRPPISYVTINLLNFDDKPLPQIPLEITNPVEKFNKTTNEQGQIQINDDSFIDKSKVNVKIYLEEKGKEKKVSKSFIYKGEQKEYTIKIQKKRRFWWLWLLLLLPLVLLIRCEKDVVIKTNYKDSNLVVPNCDVSFKYNKSFVYDKGSFFTNEPVSLLKKSDSLGIVRFEKLEYSVYSFVFKFLTSAFICSQNSCFASDTLTPLFHTIYDEDVITLNLTPITITYDFRILDKSDQQPLPKVHVIALSEYAGVILKDSAISDANGGVLFNTLPKCGKIICITANLDGYYPDSICNVRIDDIAGPIEPKRILHLTPIKEKVIFFVKNCKNRQPVPDAQAKITIVYPNGEKQSQTINTNVNGVGKGEYDEAHIIADIYIEARKKYYKDGKLSQSFKVKDFIKLPDSLRTICLEPLENVIEFFNVDANTQLPLVGVKNFITIKNGSAYRYDTIISNSNGRFNLGSIIIGDIISIRATYPPNYEDNTTTINGENAIKLLESKQDKRTIPLKPREVVLTFRTLNPKDNSLIADAELNVIIDGKEFQPPRNSINGEFTVKAPYSAIISIVADKIEYEKNDTKVKDKAVSILMTAAQTDRDIPLIAYEKIKHSITIKNSNSLPDEVFDLVVNGIRLGRVAHTLPRYDETSFSIELFFEQDNSVELLLLETSIEDTGSQILISPGSFNLDYGGRNKSYNFTFNVKNKDFRLTN
jgi:hypothetical protein